MAKKRDILLTVLFCGFIGAMAALTAFLPKQEVSVNEKRTLAKFPEFSVQKLFNGKWEKDFEYFRPLSRKKFLCVNRFILYALFGT